MTSIYTRTKREELFIEKVLEGARRFFIGPRTKDSVYTFAFLDPSERTSILAKIALDCIQLWLSPVRFTDGGAYQYSITVKENGRYRKYEFVTIGSMSFNMADHKSKILANVTTWIKTVDEVYPSVDGYTFDIDTDVADWCVKVYSGYTIDRPYVS